MGTKGHAPAALYPTISTRFISPYQLQTTYDAQNRPVTITFPNGDFLRYTYGDHGKAVSVSLYGSPLVQTVSYNAFKKVTTLALGNGLQTTWKYFGIDQQASVNNRWYGLPYQVQTASLQNQTFGTSNGYDLVGNPTSLSYADHTSESLTFAYDALDQIPPHERIGHRGVRKLPPERWQPRQPLVQPRGQLQLSLGGSAPSPRSQLGEQRRQLRLRRQRQSSE